MNKKFLMAATLMLVVAVILSLEATRDGSSVAVITRYEAETTTESDIVSVITIEASASVTTAEAAPVSTAAETEARVFPIDLNTADRAALLLLPDIGETLAERILGLRAELGGFMSVDELLGVDGIGKGTLSKLRAYIYITPPDIFPLDLNRATERELLALPGIDAELAKSIIELRTKIHYFSDPRELLYIDGMPEKTVASLLELVRAEPPDGF